MTTNSRIRNLERVVASLKRKYQAMHEAAQTQYNRYYAKCVRNDREKSRIYNNQRVLRRLRVDKRGVRKLVYLLTRLKGGRTVVALKKKPYAKLKAWLHFAEHRGKRWVRG